MKVRLITEHTIGTLIDWGEDLYFPNEYQRAAVWKPDQKMMFIDSILRGYSIPAFYFYARGEFHPPEGEGDPRPRYEVVDGQQRIRAIREFVMQNGFSLLDPSSGFQFPNFVQDKDCQWAGKRFDNLSGELQNKFKNQEVVIYEITTSPAQSNEVRDLFIRLQGGTPLTPQDKRDAWPGKFTKFILQIGGKPELNPGNQNLGNQDYYPGHDFFTSLVKGMPKSTTKRRLAAQIVMLHFRRVEGALCDIKSRNLDIFYHNNIDFGIDGEPGNGVRKVLDKLVSVFPTSRDLAGHEAIHLFLLTSSLMQEYAPGWEQQLPEQFNEFRKRCKKADKAQRNNLSNEDEEYAEYWRRYTRWTRTSSDERSIIESRHEFFVGEMLHLLKPTPLDSKRSFTPLLREIVFFRDKRLCQWCKMREEHGEINPVHSVSLKDAEIHHVVEHHRGGSTTLTNAALVHHECHPKRSEDVEKFQQWWETRLQKINTEGEKSFSALPSGTQARFTYDEEEYNGVKEGAWLVIDGTRKFKTFSAASKAIASSSRNGWRDWEIQLPGSNDWVLADAWRKYNA